MQVRVSRSGGFAGLEEELGEVDTTTLDAAHADSIVRMVHDAGFFELPETLPGDSIGADQFRYMVTVIDGDRRHTVTYTDSDEPVISGSEAPSPRSTVRRMVEAVQHAG